MKKKILSVLFALVLALSLCLVTAAPVGATVTVDVETVPVGNPGNGPDDTGYGAVAYAYNIGKYEVTAGQYTVFLNAVAGTDPYGLYNTGMDSYGCRIERTGTDGDYSYSVASDWADRPMNFVSFWDACRFANWLHNGQGSGDTETGAYTLTADGITNNTVTRNEGWQWAVTSEDEWYKAAYHKNDGLTGNYFDYPTSSDILPSNDLPDEGNNANFWQDNDYTLGGPYYRTLVGEFELSESPYGTFDQGGNVWEWNEAGVGSSYRYHRGGGFAPYMGAPDGYFLGVEPRGGFLPTDERNDVGFRVVQTAPIWVDNDYTAGSCGEHTWDVDAFATIQAGIDAVVSSGTVNVAEGIYDEQVVITKSLTLQGAGDTTVIQPSTTTASALTVKHAPWTGTSTKKMAAIVWVDTSGSTVTVKDLKIDGVNITESCLPSGIGSNEWVAGLSYLETSGTVDTVRVEDVYISDGLYRTCGIWTSAIEYTSTVEVKHSTVIKNNRAGIYGLGDKLTVDFNHNTMTGPGTLANQVPNAIFLMEGCIFSCTYNTISQYHYSGDTYRSSGIGTYRPGADLIFGHNEIYNVQNAIAIAGGSGATIEYNNIHDCHTGVKLEAIGDDRARNVMIQYNDIVNNDFAIRGGKDMGDGNEAHYNNFVGNLGAEWVWGDTWIGAVCNLHDTFILDATNNWWGTTDESEIAAMVSGNVDFAPWLESLPDLTVQTDVSTPPTTSLVVPGFVTATVPFDISGTTTNPVQEDDGKDFAHVRFNITLTGPALFGAGTPREDIFTITYADDPLGLQGFNETFVEVGGKLVGYWGPAEGFEMLAGYGPITARFTVEMTNIALVGKYTVLVELVDLDDGDYVVADATEDFTLSERIGITLSETLIDFGEILPGRASVPQSLGITNVGTVGVVVSAETESAFYNQALMIDDSTLGDLSTWTPAAIAVDGTHEAHLVVTVPPDWGVGTETGTIIFWAEPQ